VGALEKQMETDLGLKASQYDMLNSLFFVPNIVLPLFTGGYGSGVYIGYTLYTLYTVHYTLYAIHYIGYIGY
jgi:hypothetical protein